MQVISIKIPSIPDNITIIESFIDNAKEKYKISSDLYGNIMVATTEAVNNAILHGNKSNEKKNVSIKLELLEKKLIFTVEDKGRGFDYNNIADPTDPANLERIGGRGIFLIKHLADKIEFNESGSSIIMTFNM